MFEKLFLMAGLLTTQPQLALDPRYNEPKPLKRVALVVGNGSYKSETPLPGSLADAEEMRKRLEEAHYDVVVVATDIKTRREFVEKYFLPFLDRIEGAFAVFYFSGHGFHHGDSDYLTPLEIPKCVAERDADFKFMATSDLQEKVKERRPALALFLLDACRNTINIFAPACKDAEISAASQDTGGLPSVDGGKEVKPIQNAVVTTESPTPAPANAPSSLLPAFSDRIIFFSTDKKKESIGSGTGLSKFTSALSEFMTLGEEFNQLRSKVVNRVRSLTTPPQEPSLGDSVWEPDVYLKPSAQADEVAKELWVAAQQQDSADAVREYLRKYGLGPYGAAARLWLAEKGARTSMSTRASPSEIDAQFDSAKDHPATVPKISGPLVLPSLTKRAQDVVARSSTGLPSAAEILASAPVVVATEALAGRVAPTAGAVVAQSITAGSRINVDSLLQDNFGGSWLKGTTADSDQLLYFEVPKDAAAVDAIVGKALAEFELTPAGPGVSALADGAHIVEELKKLEQRGVKISWVSIASPDRSPQGPFSPRDATSIHLRAIHGSYLLGQAVPLKHISIVQNANFAGDNPRVRIFGKTGAD
jgi:hypothetical protein